MQEQWSLIKKYLSIQCSLVEMKTKLLVFSSFAPHSDVMVNTLSICHHQTSVPVLTKSKTHVGVSSLKKHEKEVHITEREPAPWEWEDLDSALALSPASFVRPWIRHHSL